MQIISHRGFWKEPSEKNTLNAFQASFETGFGTETDLRWYGGQLVVSHDFPSSKSIPFAQVMSLLEDQSLPLALNVKCDGLAGEIKSVMSALKYENYFVFDMSTPDLIQQLKAKNRAFTGLSDLQKNPVLIEECEGIWLDAFRSDWYSSKLVDRYIDMGKKVCIVSSELHGREYKAQWQKIAKAANLRNENLILCTDVPTKAKKFFGA